MLNVKGAAERLGCSKVWIHRLVAAGQLRSYAFSEEGELIEHIPGTAKGTPLFFSEKDIEVFHARPAGRPAMPKPAKMPVGRPRKPRQDEENLPKRSRGRPRKTKNSD